MTECGDLLCLFMINRGRYPFHGTVAVYCCSFCSLAMITVHGIMGVVATDCCRPGFTYSLFGRQWDLWAYSRLYEGLSKDFEYEILINSAVFPRPSHVSHRIVKNLKLIQTKSHLRQITTTMHSQILLAAVLTALRLESTAAITSRFSTARNLFTPNFLFRQRSPRLANILKCVEDFRWSNSDLNFFLEFGI